MRRTYSRVGEGQPQIQIDFGRYCVDLMREIEAGEERAAARL
jgi:hypothetical protein